MNELELESLSNCYASPQNAEEIAAALGCTVVYPSHNQLQLDIDTEEQDRQFRELLDTETILPRDAKVAGHPSKSGKPHYHITLTLPNSNFTELERIALQLALGSDPKREIISAIRLLKGEENVTRFFEPIK